MRLSPWLPAVFALASFVSCKKDTTSPAMPVPVTGTWNWILQVHDGLTSGNYSGSPLGDSLTPASTGIKETLTIDPKGNWSLVQNGKTVNGGMWKWDTLLSPEGPIPLLDLVRTGGTDSVLNHVILHDTLVTSSVLIDSVGIASVYVKTSAN